MAAADTLQYSPYSPTRSGLASFHFSPSPVASASTPASFADFIPPAKWAALQSQWNGPAFRDDDFATPPFSPTVPPGAIIAANVVTNHGKLHKRAVQKSSRSKSKHDDFHPASDIALTRTKTPPASAGASPIDGPRSPSTRSITRGILKQNLRKLSHHQGDNEPDITIDLSRTAEENEERSGLGITTSRSTSDLRTAAGAYRGHSRSHSHNSQISTTSGPYQPTVPYVLSMRDTPRSYSPPLPRPYTASIEGLDFSGEGYERMPEDAARRLRRATIDSSASIGDHRPKLRLITNTEPLIAPDPIFNQNPSLTSLERISTRPRRSTNQSARSATEQNMTPKSKTSAEARNFNFLSRPKQNDPVDALTRAATIQAARQAFDDREEGKIRKYEEQEQRAISRQQRKVAKAEERKHRKSDAGVAAPAVSLTTPSAAWSSSHNTSNGGTPVERVDFVSGGEYASLESLPMPGSSSSGAAHTTARAMLEHGIPDSTPDKASAAGAITKRRPSVRMTYVQFLTWMRTKLLNAGRKRRHQ